MEHDELAKKITTLFEAGGDWRDVMPAGDAHSLVHNAIEMLDRGEIRVAETDGERVVVYEWVKHAILMWFRVREMQLVEAGPFEYVDKLPLKRGYLAAGVRVVPGASARFGAYLARGVVMMPSYVNIGAYVDEGTMVDTWATVGSCAQIGKNVHLSGGVGIGGVLEPPQASPVIIEDDCFIGSRCMIVEGARVRKGAKLGPGLIFTATIPVIEAETGNEVGRGVIPERAIVVSGTRMREFPGGTFGMPCALVLRYLDEGEQHDKLKLNALLREHGIVS
jgi:2,3,4,5-tetrahydropyridine-2-carboxylate N-succinyltransferase